MFRAILLSVPLCLSLALSGRTAETASINVTAFVEYPIGYLQVESTKNAISCDIIRPCRHENNWVVYEASNMNPDYGRKDTGMPSDSGDFIITIINLAD